MGCELRCVADAAWQTGQWALALNLYLEVLRRRLSESGFQTSAPTADDHQLLERASCVAALFGRAEEADLLLAGLSESCRRQGLPLDADRVFLQRVQLALDRGCLAEAYELLDAMRPTLGNVFDGATLDTTPPGMIRWERERHWAGSGDRHAFFAQFYLDMGRMAAQQGDFGLATITLERGLYHALGEFSVDAGNFGAPLRLALADALIEAGDLRSAGGELALAHLRIDEVREPGYAMREKELWATVHMLAGEFGACLDQLRQVVVFLRRQELLLPALRAQLNLAHAQIFLLQTVEAQHLVAFVADQARLLRDSDLQCRARQLMLLADRRLRQCVPERGPSVRSMQGETPGMERRERVSHLCSAAPSGSFLERLEGRAAAFRALLESGDLAGADRDWSDIRAGFAFSDSALVRTRLMTLEAALLGSHKQYERALAVLWRVLPGQRALGLKPELAAALSLAATCAEDAGSPAACPALIEESLELTDELARSLPAPERLMFLLGQSAVEEKWLRVQLDRIGSLAGLPASAAIWSEVDSVLSRAEAHKELLYSEILGQPSASRSDPDAASRNNCPGNRAVVTFNVLSDRVFVVCYTRGDFGFRIRTVDRRQVRELVAQWHTLLKHSGNGTGESAEAGQKLAASLGLFELLDKLPAAVSELVFMPDDSLHGFPFAALRDAKGYLIERYAISIAHRRPRPPVVKPAVARPLLAAAMCGTKEYQVLHIVNELAWLAELFPGSRQLAAEEVNRHTLLQELPGADLLHMVCHGEFSCEHPEKTGLVPVPRTGISELLSLTDIAALTLPGLQHATLVACWAADNYVLPGRWVLGIAETLCCSGADSVLASLWKTRSFVADRFVRAFHSHLRQAPRNQALQRAQLEFLKRGELLVDWAGWQLYGETGALKFC